MSFASFDLVDFNETFIYFLLVLDAIFIVTSCLAFEGGVSIRANTTTVSLSVMSQLYVMSQPYLSHLDHKLIVFELPCLFLLDYHL
jgi:hypothetical protein